jgi:Zn-dependent M28 family amino/carboxypeptidase
MNVNFQTQNIIAYIPGKIDSFIVFSAHYDHLGILGQVYFPGANDNASGVAMVLSLAKHFANRKTPPKYNLAFILFSGEELGLLGSLYFVTHPTFDLNKIKLLVNLDMVGSGDQGITVVNAFNQKKAFQLLKQINSQLHLLPSVKPRKNAPDSDHYPFTLKKIPAIFIYTRGRYKQYHSIYDRPDSLYYDYFPKLEKLLYTFTEKY